MRTPINVRRWLGLAAVVGVLLFALAGCGSSSSSSSNGAAGSTTGSTTGQIAHAKTKFVLHAGLAFGAFHHWIYKPARAGELSHPLRHKLATLEAAVAAAFVYHELKLALSDAQSDPTLSKLVAPITALENKLKGLGSEVKGGSASPSSVDNVNGSISSIKQQSSAAGQPITEQVPSSPNG